MKVLVIEDELQLQDSIRISLEKEKFVVDVAMDFHSAMQKIYAFEYDCIILDIMLPFGSGLDLLKQLKEEGKEDGVIIISAKNSADDKIHSLNLGADDYLAKPFHLAELSARIQSIIRCKNFSNSYIINYKNLNINLQSKEVKVLDKEVEITKTEFSLLLFLLRNKNKVVSKNAIAENLSGQSALYFDNFDIIYSHIKNLKRKLGVAGDYIETIYSTGYKLN